MPGSIQHKNLEKLTTKEKIIMLEKLKKDLNLTMENKGNIINLLYVLFNS